MSRRNVSKLFGTEYKGVMSLFVGDRFDSGKMLHGVQADGVSKGGRLGIAYPFPMSLLTVDVGVVTRISKSLYLLLVRRRGQPFKNCWALPGGFVDIMHGEHVEDAARRELKEETGIDVETKLLSKVMWSSGPDRDPRGYSTTILFGTQVDYDDINPCAGDDASDVRWVEMARENFRSAKQHGDSGGGSGPSRGPKSGEKIIYSTKRLDGAKIPLAFDHLVLVENLIEKYRSKAQAITEMQSGFPNP